MACREVDGENQWFIYNCGFCRHAGRAFEDMKLSKAGYDCFNEECPKHFSNGKKKKIDAAKYFDQTLSNDEMELAYLVENRIPATKNLLAKAKNDLKAKRKKARRMNRADASHMLIQAEANVALLKVHLADYVSRRDALMARTTP